MTFSICTSDFYNNEKKREYKAHIYERSCCAMSEYTTISSTVINEFSRGATVADADQ